MRQQLCELREASDVVGRIGMITEFATKLKLRENDPTQETVVPVQIGMQPGQQVGQHLDIQAASALVYPDDERGPPIDGPMLSLIPMLKWIAVRYSSSRLGSLIPVGKAGNAP